MTNSQPPTSSRNNILICDFAALEERVAAQFISTAERARELERVARMIGVPHARQNALPPVETTMPEQTTLPIPFSIPEDAVPSSTSPLRVALVENKLFLAGSPLTSQQRRHLRLKVQRHATGYGTLANAATYGLNDGGFESVYIFDATVPNLKFLREMAPTVCGSPLAFINAPNSSGVPPTWQRPPNALVAANVPLAPPPPRAAPLPAWVVGPAPNPGRGQRASATGRNAAASPQQSIPIPASTPRFDPAKIVAEYLAADTDDPFTGFFLVFKKIPKAGPYRAEQKKAWDTLQEKLPNLKWLDTVGWSMEITLARVTTFGACEHTPTFASVTHAFHEAFGIRLTAPTNRSAFLPVREEARSSSRVRIPGLAPVTVERAQVLAVPQQGVLWLSVPYPGRAAFAARMNTLGGMWFPWLQLWRMPLDKELPIRTSCIQLQNQYDAARGWVSLRDDLGQEICAYQIPVADAKLVLEKKQCPFQRTSLLESVVHLRLDLALTEARHSLMLAVGMFNRVPKLALDAESLDETLLSMIFQLDPEERDMIPEAIRHYNRGGCPACRPEAFATNNERNHYARY